MQKEELETTSTIFDDFFEVLLEIFVACKYFMLFDLMYFS
jgi:hypothetical protein